MMYLCDVYRWCMYVSMWMMMYVDDDDDDDDVGR